MVHSIQPIDVGTDHLLRQESHSNQAMQVAKGEVHYVNQR